MKYTVIKSISHNTLACIVKLNKILQYWEVKA